MGIGLKQQKSSGRPAWSAPGLTDLPVIPNLQVEALIGIGGMGAVYRARQTHIDRQVALKVLDPSRSSDRSFAERFTREARAMARLDHPAIVRLYDFGQSGSWLWLTMDLVEGATLRGIIRTGNLAVQESLDLALQLCDALSHAQGAGVIHRDLKPEHILIDGHGRPKSADFGLAKLNSDLHSHTATGAVMGTAVYMAPEQIAGDEIDHRADIYTMGVVLYEMFTGLQPLGRFAMPSRTQGIDPRLDEVVLKCLEREPLRRWKTAGDLRRALEDATSAETDPPRKAEWERSTSSRKGRKRSVFPDIQVSVDNTRSEKRSGFSGIRINSDGVTIGDVAAGKEGQRADEDQADGTVGVRSCYDGGMFLLAAGCLICVWQFLGHDLDNQRITDVGTFGALCMAAGGISLLTLSGLILAIAGSIAAFVTVPWIWHQLAVLGIGALLVYLAIVPRALRMHRLRRHYASTSKLSRFWHWSFAAILTCALYALCCQIRS